MVIAFTVSELLRKKPIGFIYPQQDKVGQMKKIHKNGPFAVNLMLILLSRLCCGDHLYVTLTSK